MASNLDQIAVRLREVTGVNLDAYRRPTVKRRLEARMERLGVPTEAAYLDLLKSQPEECQRLVDVLGVNVSSFFRNALVFELIRKTILPAMCAEKRRRSDRELRVWSAGCATGEEAYSLAILVHGAIEGEVASWAPHVFATDIDEDALNRAAAGIYQRESLQSTKLGILDKYFILGETGNAIRPFIKRMVKFSRHDLTAPGAPYPPDSVFGTFDLVLCRNVLIYFSAESRAKALGDLCNSVARGGYLILGEAEHLDARSEARMETINAKSRIFRRRPR